MILLGFFLNFNMKLKSVNWITFLLAFYNIMWTFTGWTESRVFHKKDILAKCFLGWKSFLDRVWGTQRLHITQTVPSYISMCYTLCFSHNPPGKGHSFMSFINALEASNTGVFYSSIALYMQWQLYILRAFHHLRNDLQVVVLL